VLRQWHHVLLLLLPMKNSCVQGDPVEPGTQFGITPKAMQVQLYLHQHFLVQVVRIILIRHTGPAYAIQPVPVLLHNLLK
jgi:hypothetical protein